jgi:hypothetical protein
MFKSLCLTGLFFFISCESSENCCTNYESDVFLKVINSEGKDLLALNQKVIDANVIKVFYLTIDGKMEEVNKSNLDSPKGYKIITPVMDNSSNYKIQLILNSEHLNLQNISYTYLKWSENDTDEFKAEFKKQGQNLMVIKIWVNDELKWDLSGDRVITIIK